MNFWVNISAEFHQDLKQIGKRKRVENDEHLFLEGDHFTGFYVVHAGHFRIFNINENGEQATISIAEAGSAISTVPVLLGITEYHANCQALTPSEVDYFPLEPFKSYLMTSAKLVFEFAGLVLGHTLAIREKYLSLALATARERFISFLQHSGAHEQFIALPASKRVIASLLDITPETLSRLLKTLENEGTIQSRANTIKLNELDPGQG